MGREREEEKLFSENIDRLLAGEDIQTDARMENDLRTALEFARKMQDLRPGPSSVFQSHLKAELLQKLDEQEEKTQKGWFWRFIPREPIWQAAAVLAIMIVVGGVVWGTLLRPAPPMVVNVPTPPPVITSAPAMTSAPATTAAAAPTAAAKAMYLRADANTSKTAYAPGETVKINLSWQNVTAQYLTVEQFPPILSLMQKSTRQPVYTFPAGQASWTLAPGETVSYQLEWAQTDNQGRHTGPGEYYLELEEMYYQGQSVPMNLAQPVSFDILPATTGAGKVLNLDQTQTVNGVTVTLQRIEITETGFIVSVFTASPPDYVLQPGTPSLRPTVNYQASAGYSLDGGWVRDSGMSSVEYFGHGMNHTWYVPGKLLPEAGEMTFIVNNIGSWTGPWQFKIALH